MRCAITVTALAALLLSLTIIVAAQTQPLAFAVASIKPDKWEPGLIMGGGCRGRDTKIGGALPIAPPPLGGCRMTR
jgi:hypothetical protein